MIEERHNFIDNRWVETADGRRVPVVDPATDRTLAMVPVSGPGDVLRAVDAASRAFDGWSSATATERSAVLDAMVRLVGTNRDRLSETISAESGKPRREADAEITYATGFLQWAAEEARRVYGETVPSARPDQRILVVRQPVGVTAAITPWNFPMAMLTRKLGPALAVGCTQVVKPATQTPLTAMVLCELALEAGVPPGVLNLVVAPGSVFADVVMDDPRVRKVSFTGSTEVGQELVRRSAAHLTRLSLELGGHAPFLVLGDADLEVAVRGAVNAKFRNAGQSCIAANRFYVARDLYDEFCGRFADAVADLRLGAWTDGADVGPLIDDAGADKVLAHVDDAVGRGAKLLCGGQRATLGEGYANRFVEPTVLADVTDDMLIFTEETFGPVAGLSPFDDDDEAVHRANGSPFGLAAYVFGRDIGRLRRVVEQLQCGVVGLNDGLPSAAQAPFGGVKMSGYGREGGHFVTGEYLDTKYVSVVA